MTSYALLLRAVNVGAHNRLAMTDLRALLAGLGHQDVRTFLSSGNATFASAEPSPGRLASQIEAALRAELGLDVRAWVRTRAALQAALAGLPPLDGYVLVAVLFDRPAQDRLQELLAADWAPDRVVGTDEGLYLSYARGVQGSKLTTARIEKLLGVRSTTRTPATLETLVAGD